MARNLLLQALARKGLQIADLQRLIARDYPEVAVSEAQIGRIVNGRRGASLPLAAAIEAVLGGDVTAAQIATLPRQPRAGRGVT